jgi:hypothetical protein
MILGGAAWSVAFVPLLLRDFVASRVSAARTGAICHDSRISVMNRVSRIERFMIVSFSLVDRDAPPGIVFRVSAREGAVIRF